MASSACLGRFYHYDAWLNRSAKGTKQRKHIFVDGFIWYHSDQPPEAIKTAHKALRQSPLSHSTAKLTALANCFVFPPRCVLAPIRLTVESSSSSRCS